MENQIKKLVLVHNRITRELSICQTQLRLILGNPLDENISNSLIFSRENIPEIPNKLPSVSLKGRPDILEKQTMFFAQYQLTKASELDLYPSLSLN